VGRFDGAAPSAAFSAARPLRFVVGRCARRRPASERDGLLSDDAGENVGLRKAHRDGIDKQGSVTAGNASGINDGGAAVVVMSGSRAG